MAENVDKSGFTHCNLRLDVNVTRESAETAIAEGFAIWTDDLPSLVADIREVVGRYGILSGEVATEEADDEM